MAAALDLLAPGGPLARQLAGYEARPGQLEMAAAVERVLSEDGVLICEAGTGTGKTLAYLVPAILSGKKVVVSTATRNLQEQIVAHDLPLIERTLGLAPRAAVMKGLGNYLCRRRHAAFAGSAEALRPSYARALRTLDSWIGETETGDIAELAGLPESDPVWREVTSSSDTRVGSSCAFYEDCFVTRMRRDAEAARLLIVNHHLFFADLALRGPHPGRVIPDYDAVIFDEAHQLEDIATDFFGVRVSRSRIERLLRDLERALHASGQHDALLGGAAATRGTTEVHLAADSLWRELARHGRPEDGRVTLEHDVWAGPVLDAWHRLDSALEGLSALAETARGRIAGGDMPRAQRDALADALLVGARRADESREALAMVARGAPGRVTWFEQSGNNATLASAPVDVADVFRVRVFESVPAVVLTSATLASPGDDAESPFSYVRSRLGVADERIAVREVLVPSPFDFEHNALLYLPRDLPPPNAPAFTAAAVERVVELVRITGGGAFVLTTSLRSMRALHRALATRLPGHRVLVQGDAPKSALVAAFRAAGDAVLVATMSFWEGVDVPGHALRLVVLEKIPFAVPTDPIVRARGLALEAEGGNAFMQLHVPAAAITLKQGFGRLIRTRSDRGIVALLDERVHRRGYGKKLLATLPPARVTSDLAEVRVFWGCRPGAEPRVTADT